MTLRSYVGPTRSSACACSMPRSRWPSNIRCRSSAPGPRRGSPSAWPPRGERLYGRLPFHGHAVPGGRRASGDRRAHVERRRARHAVGPPRAPRDGVRGRANRRFPCAVAPGERRLIARAGYHGAPVRWLPGAAPKIELRAARGASPPPPSSAWRACAVPCALAARPLVARPSERVRAPCARSRRGPSARVRRVRAPARGRLALSRGGMAAQLVNDGLKSVDRLAYWLRRLLAVGGVPWKLGELASDLLAHTARTYAVVQVLLRLSHLTSSVWLGAPQPKRDASLHDSPRREAGKGNRDGGYG